MVETIDKVESLSMEEKTTLYMHYLSVQLQLKHESITIINADSVSFSKSGFDNYKSWDEFFREENKELRVTSTHRYTQLWGAYDWYWKFGKDLGL